MRRWVLTSGRRRQGEVRAPFSFLPSLPPLPDPIPSSSHCFLLSCTRTGGGASSMKEVLRVGVGSGGATGGGEGMRDEGGGGRNVVSKIAVTGSPMSGRNETASTNMFGRLFLR